MFSRNRTSEHFASFDAERTPLEEIRVFVQNALLDSPLTRKNIASLMLAIEEAVTNIIRHGYLYGPGKIRITVRRDAQWVHLKISDTGRAYALDSEGETPSIEQMAATGRKGGLGLVLIRKVSDHVEHTRVGDENILTLSKRLSRPIGESLTKSSWKRRVAWSGSAIVTFAVLVVFILLHQQMLSNEREEFSSEWGQFGLTAAAAASQHILNDRSDVEFDQFVVGLKAAHIGVEYVIILSHMANGVDSGGVIRAHSESPDRVHEVYKPPFGIPLETTGQWAMPGDSGRVLHFVETARVGGEAIGQVVWGVPEQVLNSHLASERSSLLKWAIGVLMAGWLFVWLGSAWMARPIQRLAGALQQAKDRNTKPSAASSSAPEEIRQVLAAFEEATDSVAQTERRVAERAVAQREMEASQHLQKALLPNTLPEILGYELSAMCRMARHVGGDYYDLIPLNNRQWFIIVADVAGKGLPAALTMTAFRTATRLIAPTVSSPRALLTSLHHFLVENHPSGPFVTTLCCLLDVQSHKLEVTSAGHPPLLVRRQDNGSVFKVRPSGRPVGIPLLGDTTFEERLGSEIVELYDQDWVVMFTDGLAEARQPGGETYGVDKIGQLIGANQSASADSLIETIVRDVDQYSNDVTTSDDLTVLALRRSSIQTEAKVSRRTPAAEKSAAGIR